MIKTIEDVNLINDVFNYDVILVPMSINNSFAKGFKYEIALNFPGVKEKEGETYYGDNRKYGTVLPVKVGHLLFCICYMYVTPCYKNKGDIDTVRYDDLKKCLYHIKEKYPKKKIASPILGADKFDGNGDKSKIFHIFAEIFDEGIDLTLYDFDQRDYTKDIFNEIAELHAKFLNKEVDSVEYILKRSAIEWRRRYGIFEQMPDNYRYFPRKGEKYIN